MQTAALPANEDERIAELRGLDLLDTPAEDRFDRITRTAARLFDVPIALVSLVDSCRQWFKSRQGLDACETERDISFCGHAIHAGDILLVPDAHQDPRFADNPLVTGPPFVRFYAGAPLTTGGGYRVGTLCVIDVRPRVFSSSDLRALRDLADWVQDEFSRTRTGKVIGLAHEQEALLRAIMNTVVDGIITIDERGTVESINPAAVNLFGHPPEDVIGKNVNILMPEPYHREHDGYLARFLETRAPRVIGMGREVVGKRRDGSTFPMDLAVSETVVSGRRFFTGIVRDITERKQAERMKDEFVSTVSHELRTPLTSILGSLGLIAGEVGGPLAPQVRQLVDIARSNSERLVRLINDILDMEKIKSGMMQFEFRVQPILPLVKKAIEDNLGYADQHQVGIELISAADDSQARVDDDRLIQIITNFLSNAAKFSPAGGVVKLALTRENESLRIAVSNQGTPISEEFRQRIFQKFSQADSSDTRQKGGTGLGLAISKSLVESMGGGIGFSSTELETCFWITLPEAKPEP